MAPSAADRRVRLEDVLPPPARTASGRLAHIDILRTLAIGLVIIHHHGPCPDGMNSTWAACLRVAQHGGGVDLFLVLSGYLVGGLLFREYQRDHTIGVRRFLL